MIMLIVYLIAVAVARTGVAKAEESEEKLRVQATTDALTGVYNRGELMTRGEEEAARVLRHGPDGRKGELCLIMLDIDHFKRINNTFGHQAGDAVLEQLAGRIKQGLRLYDILGRYGGEEFMLMLPTADLQVSERIAERIRSSVEAKPFSYNGSEIRVTISLGVATFAPNFILDETISRADKALFRAKKGGRNRVETETSPIARF
jgi:diguanylate cyclase